MAQYFVVCCSLLSCCSFTACMYVNMFSISSWYSGSIFWVASSPIAATWFTNAADDNSDDTYVQRVNLKWRNCFALWSSMLNKPGTNFKAKVDGTDLCTLLCSVDFSAKKDWRILWLTRWVYLKLHDWYHTVSHYSLIIQWSSDVHLSYWQHH